MTAKLIDGVPRLLADAKDVLVPIITDVGEEVVLRNNVAGTKATVGYDYWILLKHKIQQRLGAHPEFPFYCNARGLVTHLPTGISFYFYRCGLSEGDAIDESFPVTGRAAVADAEQKLYGEPLFPADVKHLSQTTLVLAFFGNAEDGSCALYFAVVGAINQRHIIKWAETKLIWVRTDGGGRSATNQSPDLPPAAVPQVVEVKRKRKYAEGTGQ